MIGILGYNGLIGQSVVHYLSGKYSIRCGSRSISKNIINSDIEYIQVNAEDDNSLENFCRGCKVVVNCIGPSYFFSKRIIEIIKSMGISYVDAFGVNLFDLQDQISIPVIIGAGSIPGLSGILPVWAKQNEEYETIKIFAGGKEKLTLTACEDLLMSILNKFGKADMYYYDNTIKREQESIELPEVFLDNAKLCPYLTEELIQSASYCGIKELHWFNVQYYPEYNEIMSRAILKLVRDKSPSNLRKVAKEVISNLSEGNLENDFTYRIVVETGTMVGLQKNIYAWESEDSYCINGFIAASCAEILYSKHYENGIYWPFQILNCQSVVGNLVEKGVLRENKLFNFKGDIDTKWEDDEV